MLQKKQKYFIYRGAITLIFMEDFNSMKNTEQKNKNIIIFNDDVADMIEKNKDIIIDNLNDYEMKICDANIYSEAHNMIDEDAAELLTVLDRFDNNIKYDYILCVAVLGLWYGRRNAIAKFKTLKEAMQKCFYDINKIYFKNKNTSLQLESVHHDGVNHYKFYKVVNNKKYAIKLNEVIL